MRPLNTCKYEVKYLKYLLKVMNFVVYAWIKLFLVDIIRIWQ